MILQPGDTIQIINGPSKFDFAMAFVDRFGPSDDVRFKREQRSVLFTTGFRTAVGDNAVALCAKVRIVTLRHENGTGHGWYFEGVLTGTGSFTSPATSERIKGFYDSRSHKGFFEAN